MKGYKVWCEWDIGEDTVYLSREAAEKAIGSNPAVGDLIRDMGFSGIDEIFASGLMIIEEVTVDA